METSVNSTRNGSGTSSSSYLFGAVRYTQPVDLPPPKCLSSIHTAEVRISTGHQSGLLNLEFTAGSGPSFLNQRAHHWRTDCPAEKRGCGANVCAAWQDVATFIVYFAHRSLAEICRESSMVKKGATTR